MAITCARCGTPNPDGNQFCQACGTPLTAGAASAAPAAPPQPPPAAPPGPPVAFASPPPTPFPYQSPYYSPSAGAVQPPVHHTPWVLILSAVVALVVVMAGCGTALALLGGGKVTVSGGISSQLPSPTPAGSPSPIASPTSPASGTTTASNSGETIPVPAGWAVANKASESITLVNPSGDGSVTVASGASNPKQTAQQNKDTADKYFLNQYPDTKDCPNSKTTTGTLAGASGIFWELCFTLTASGHSLSAAAPMFAGANADGSVYYLVILLTGSDNMTNLVNESRPILQGIQWKLQ
ncbi:zinc-ribbon domain-containing protein [bacterium]|nr:MAG: zinc-ribbon domain-containing protein [bacterium]